MVFYNEKTVKKGYYHVINKDKLRNEKKVLYYRSGLEKKMMEICDHSTSILEWSYEDVILEYQLQKDLGTNITHRYIMDFWVKKRIKGIVKEYLVEIKPYALLFPPKVPKRKTKKFLEEVELYSINLAKWNKAQEFAKSNGISFVIVTEKTLS